MNKTKNSLLLFTTLALGLSTITFGLVKHSEDHGVVVRELTEEEIANPIKAEPFEVYDSFATDNTKFKNNNQKCSMSILGSGTDVNDVWNAYRGDDTVIAVIDSGIDYNHPDFKFSDGTSKILATSRYYYINNNTITYNQYGVMGTSSYNFLDHNWDTDNNELNAHGTNVASTAASAINGNGGTVGIAPNAKILVLKTDFYLSSIAEAIKYAVNQKVDVINMSFGAYATTFTDSYGTTHTGSSSVASALTSAINAAYSAGIIVVAAAGNENTSYNSYPACNDHVIGVGALASASYSKASFSNYNDSNATSSTTNVNVDLSAPGYVYQADETATYSSGTISNRTHAFTNTQGTSFASPIVAGAACLWKQKNPNGTPTQFETALYNSCDDKGSTGWDTTFGHGVLNLSKLLLDDTAPTSIDVVAKGGDDGPISINSGDHVQLYHQVLPLVAKNKTVTWSSSNAAVASVNSSSGVVTGGSTSGSAVVTATTSNGATGTITINNGEVVPVTGVSFTNDEVTVGVDSEGNIADTFPYTVLPESATNKGVTFSSSDENVILFDETSWVSGGEGTATVTVTSVADSSISDTCTVRVSDDVETEGEYVYKSLTFAKENTTTSTSGYTSVSATYTYNGFSINTTNFNNYSRNWDYIKCGGKNGAYTGTLTTGAAIDKIVSKINLSVDNFTSDYVTSAKLLISNSSSTSGASEVAITLASPTTSISIPSSLMAANKYYIIEIACTKASSNGVVQLSAISFLVRGTGGETQEATLDSISVSNSHRTFKVNDTFVPETVTAHYTDNTEKTVTGATFSSPDMTTAGSKTVDVSYTESSITKSTSYTITVNEDSGGGGGDDSDDYYSTISDDISGSTLLTELRTLNLSKRTSTVSYDDMGTSPSGAFKYTDYDPTTVNYDSKGQPYGTKILSFYSGTSTTSWNREHVWPNSRGGGDKGGSGSPYIDQDIYMPRPTISSENSNRGNSKYVEGLAHSSNGWDPVTAFGESNCYMGKGIRGECARIIFYCMTVNANLVLDDTATGGTTGVTMGKLSDLLKWNLENSVNEREIRRQSGGQYLQGNRNAFVDHPEYACKIWGNYNDATRTVCNSQVDPTPKTIDHISVGNVRRTFTVGDTFVGEEITAHYTDNTTEVVTGTYSGYDMSVVGTQTVTATYESFTTTYDITVNAQQSTTTPVSGVSVSPTTATINVGGTQTLTATITPSDATNKSVTWTSSDTSVATVTSGGVVTGVKAGSATITATTTDGNFTSTCSVTVNSSSGQDDESKVTFDFTTATQRTTQTNNQNAWETQGFTFVNLKGNSSTDCANYVNPIRIYKSSNCTFTAPTGKLITKIIISGTEDNALALTGSPTCTISNDGTTYTLTPNTTTGQNSIYFAVKNQARIYDATVFYKDDPSSVTPIVNSITLSDSTKKICASETFTLTSSVNADVGAEYTVEWSITEGSSFIEFVQSTPVTGESAEIRGIAVGNATVTVTAGGKTATCSVSVVSVSSVELDLDSTTVPFGKYRNPSDIKLKVTYSDETFASINEGSTITATGTTNLLILGNVTINGSYGGKTCETTIKITNEGSSEYVGWNVEQTSSRASTKTYNATPVEQAEAWAEYFIKQTGGRDYSGACKAGTPAEKIAGLQSVWADLNNEYSYLVSLSKDEFCTNTSSAVINEARSHYNYIINTYDTLTKFVVDSANQPLVVNSSHALFKEKLNESTIIFVSIVLAGIVIISCYIIYKKRRWN